MDNKFLIVGLGNPGIIYKKTRHNFGFLILDQIANKYSLYFSEKKLGYISKLNYDNKFIFFLKPTTYVNFSGKSVKYWIIKEKILLKNVLILSDDIYLKFGIFRLRQKGGNGGHNGLKSIEKEIRTSNYARLRFGINNSKNIKNHVLNNWKNEEINFLFSKSNISIKIIFSFVTKGLQKTMNLFN
ncbi:aminoacyl-tRNA hydrolase [Blattabacterium cuenoti]|uniref:aminoacyl-tRNA hydrolase n=1 Tax=Blattabacterium cuenoti TaxID=1653831 RepID=UPI00163CA74F|nr:aminoacyl-tRNA hydrolase [Blattabacterium cuenoti]